MFVHKVLFEFLEFKHPRLLLVSPSDTSTGGGLLGVKFLASENWCGRVHFGGHSPEWRVLAKFSVQPCTGRAKLYDPAAMEEFCNKHAPGMFYELERVIRNDEKGKISERRATTQRQRVVAMLHQFSYFRNQVSW